MLLLVIKKVGGAFPFEMHRLEIFGIARDGAEAGMDCGSHEERVAPIPRQPLVPRQILGLRRFLFHLGAQDEIRRLVQPGLDVLEHDRVFLLLVGVEECVSDADVIGVIRFFWIENQRPFAPIAHFLHLVLILGALR